MSSPRRRRVGGKDSQLALDLYLAGVFIIGVVALVEALL